MSGNGRASRHGKESAPGIEAGPATFCSTGLSIFCPPPVWRSSPAGLLPGEPCGGMEGLQDGCEGGVRLKEYAGVRAAQGQEVPLGGLQWLPLSLSA